MEKLNRDILLKLLIEVNDVSKFNDEQLKSLKEKIIEEERKRYWEKKKVYAKQELQRAFEYLKKFPLTNNYETIDFITSDFVNASSFVGGIVYKKTYFPYSILFYYRITNIEYHHFTNYILNCNLMQDVKNDIINNMKEWDEDDFADFKLLFCQIFQLPIHSHLAEFFSSDKTDLFVDFTGRTF